MAWLTSAVAAQFADGRVVPKNQPRKAIGLSEAIGRTTASDRDIAETFANESDDNTDDGIIVPEPSLELTSMPPKVVSDVASSTSVQTQLGRFPAASHS